MANTLSSVEKAIDILSLFDDENGLLSAQEISKMLGIPLSTTYKYLDIFLRKGFLAKQPHTKKISLGPAIFRMGNLASRWFSIADIALPFMEELAARSRETVILAVVHGMEGLCIESVESPRPVKLTVRKGTILPLHVASMHKVLLAYKDEAFVDAVIAAKGLPKLGRNTITDVAALKSELAQIREQGYAQSDSEVDQGAASVAAPVFDHKGAIAAAITIAGPTDRIMGKCKAELVKLSMEFAARVSSELGVKQPAAA